MPVEIAVKERPRQLSSNRSQLKCGSIFFWQGLQHEDGHLVPNAGEVAAWHMGFGADERHLSSRCRSEQSMAHAHLLKPTPGAQCRCPHSTTHSLAVADVWQTGAEQLVSEQCSCSCMVSHRALCFCFQHCDVMILCVSSLNLPMSTHPPTSSTVARFGDREHAERTMFATLTPHSE
jgi:hypothetical protein